MSEYNISVFLYSKIHYSKNSFVSELLLPAQLRASPTERGRGTVVLVDLCVALWPYCEKCVG